MFVSWGKRPLRGGSSVAVAGRFVHRKFETRLDFMDFLRKIRASIAFLNYR